MATSSYIPAPRRLTMLMLSGCDFCPRHFCSTCVTTEENENNNLEVIGGNRLFGWQYCDCCTEKLKEAKNHYMMDADLLQRFFGSNYKVKRTSGDIDVGKWKVWYCLRTDSSTLKDDYSSHRVNMNHVSDSMTKDPLLTDLLQWNDRTLQDLMSLK